MKVLKSPLALLVLLGLQACSSSPQSSDSPSQAPKKIADNSQNQAELAPSFMLRGQLVVGSEGNYIQPCHSDKQYWIQLNETQYKQVEALTREPYQPLYGEVIGSLTPSDRSNSTANFDAVFNTEQISFVTAENPNRCDTPAQATRLFGAEPFWSAKFEKDSLVFQKMGGEKQPLAITSSQVRPQSREYQFADGELTMTAGMCNDTMSDSLYGWKVSLEVGDNTYKGCGVSANIDSTQSWVGDYHANSTLGDGLAIHLALNPDHSASTTYSYKSDDSELLEVGFWQQLSPTTVQVMMTHHQRQPLLSERIFTLKDGQLFTAEETVAGKTYPIAQGGLTLYPAKTQATGIKSTKSADLPALTKAQEVPSSSEFNSKVDSALRHYFKLHRTDPSNTKYRWLTYDLNGDSQDELLVQLDWCGTGGCTLLIFENHQQEWRFNSRMTLVNNPITIANSSTNGWYDLVLPVYGGGATPQSSLMQHTGVSYPINPSVAPKADANQLSKVVLFSDEITPAQQGIKL